MSENSTNSSHPEWIHRLQPPLMGAADGPLKGLRFAVKDNMDVQGLLTTAGCETFAYHAQAHAHVVQRLLDAGASLVGKTNLDQFACGLNGTRSPWGAVPNALNPRFVSGGSSSGSAVVVAKGQVDFALGTDTAGSGRVPAGLNNIVGLKPSRGLISAHGVVPAAQSVDCVSIFTRTVGLAARVLQVAMGEDPRDPYSRQLPLQLSDWKPGFRFGIPSPLEFFGDERSRLAFDNAIERMRSLGGIPVEVAYSPFEQVAALLYESALVAERYEAIQPFFDQHEAAVIEPVRSIIGQGRLFSAVDLLRAQRSLKRLQKETDAAWEHMELMLVPTAPTHYTVEAMQSDPVALNRNLGHYTNFVNLLDYAALSIPSSLRDDGLPFGVTLIGRAGSDWQLADLGQRYHHDTGLQLGATDEQLPPPEMLPLTKRPAQVQLAVVGAHLSAMPLNYQMTERGAQLLEVTCTSPDYRLYALNGTIPAKPGLLRVEPGAGAKIEVEVWEMPLEQYGSFVAMIPAPLGIGTLHLVDGRQVQGFLCEPIALQGAQDITSTGGWRRYLQSISTQQS
jgi:allophanate hydrolase